MEKALKLDTIVQANLSDTAYERIAGAIAAGQFSPGEKLTIRDLSSRLGTSSTPVRDAMRRLIAERALEQPTLREIRVPVMEAEIYREIALIRMEIEGLGASVAATKSSDADIDALDAIISDNETAIAAGNWSDATALNKEFHFRLCTLAAMPTLMDILAALWLRIGPPVAKFYRHGGRTMIDYHYDVVAALRARDATAARKSIVQDISEPVENIIAAFQPTER